MLAEQLLYNTIRIEAKLSNGEIATGSAFFFNVTLDDGNTISLVATNKHVLEDAEQLNFHLSKLIDGRPADSEIIQCNFPCNRDNPDGPLYWVDHPNDDVDLCVAFSGILHMSEKEFDTKFAIIYAQEEIIANQEYLDNLKAINDVIMIGYPIGLYDETNNKPIARKGITATHPRHRFEGRKEFLIDVPAIGGSSGSPVYLHEQGLSLDGTKLSIAVTNKLLGILYGGYDAEEGTIKVTPSSNPDYVVPMDIGVGAVVSSVRLLEMKNVVQELIKDLLEKNPGYVKVDDVG